VGFACSAGFCFGCLVLFAFAAVIVWLPAAAVFRCFLCLLGVCLSVRLRRWFLLDLDSLVFGLWSLVFGLWSLVFGLWSLAFGLSLNSYWFISVAPVRGRHLLFFACCKEK
jgi:hypothetical protein